MLRFELVRLFNDVNSCTVVPNLAAIEYSVSPLWTVYVFVVIPFGEVYGTPA